MKIFVLILLTLFVIGCESSSSNNSNNNYGLVGTWQSATCFEKSLDVFRSRTSTLTYTNDTVTFETKLYTDLSCTENELLSAGTRPIIIGDTVRTIDGLNATEIDEIDTTTTFYGIFLIDGNALYFSNYRQDEASRPNELNYNVQYLRVNQ